MANLTEQEKAKRQSAIEFANAINRIEGVPLPEKVNNLYAQWAEGEMSYSALEERILDMYRRNA